MNGAAALLAAVVLAGPATAHDFWIEPSAFTLEAPGRLALRLRVGERFAGEPVVRQAQRIERFGVLGPAGEQPALGLDGDDPAGGVRLETPGVHVAVYRSRRAPIVLEPEMFTAYLREEGLERIERLRAERGQSAAPGREVYSRCAKAFVRVGAGTAAGFDRRAGLTLELVPESDPFRAAELPLDLLVLHEGRPLAGALVVARNRAGARVAARSDGDGRARLALAAHGAWLVTTVHMLEAAPETGADWESLWASLTFEAR